MFSSVSENTASAPFGVAQQQDHRRVLLAKLAYTFSYLTSAVDGGADKLGRPSGDTDGAAASELHKHTHGDSRKAQGERKQTGCVGLLKARHTEDFRICEQHASSVHLSLVYCHGKHVGTKGLSCMLR